MPIFTITDFDKSGVNTDLPEWELPSNQFSSGQNFRCINGAINSFSGHSDYSNHPATTDLGWIQHVVTSADSFWVHAGTAKTYVFDGTSWFDTSNVAGYTGVTNHQLWSGCSIGGIPVISNPGAYPEYWDLNTANNFVDLEFDAVNSFRDLTYKCDLIRSHGQFLIALGMTEGATEYPDLIRWSDSADVGGLPPSWDETVTTNLAGTKALAGGGGNIIDALSMRNGLTVYQQGSTWQMDRVNSGYVWNFRQQNTTSGALALGCVADVMGKHVVLTDGDIVMNDGTSITSLIHRRIRTRLNSAINVDNYQNSFVTVQRQKKEVWICVPTEGATYANLAFIWNWQDDTWSMRDLPDVSFASFGARSEGAVTWADFTMPWNEMTFPWGGGTYTPLNDVMVGTRPDAATPNTVVLDPITANDGTAFETVLTKTNISIEGHDDVTTITRIYPHVTGTKDITIEVGAHTFAGSPVLWKPPVTFTPGQDRKVDVRSTGSLHAIRITGANDPVFSLSGIDVEYVKDGLR